MGGPESRGAKPLGRGTCQLLDWLGPEYLRIRFVRSFVCLFVCLFFFCFFESQFSTKILQTFTILQHRLVGYLCLTLLEVSSRMAAS